MTYKRIFDFQEDEEFGAVATSAARSGNSVRFRPVLLVRGRFGRDDGVEQYAEGREQRAHTS